jgi:hypothetical protein
MFGRGQELLATQDWIMGVIKLRPILMHPDILVLCWRSGGNSKSN